MKLSVTEKPLEWFVDKLNNNEPFSFSRYGDGEFSCILSDGKQGQMVDGQPYEADISADLKTTLDEPLISDYFIYGIQAMMVNRMQGLISEVGQKAPKIYDIKWVQSDVFHRASLKGLLNPLIKALRKKLVYLIGPEFLKCKQLDFLRTAGAYHVHETRSYEQNIIIQGTIKRFIEMVEKADSERNIIFAVSSGMTGNSIIYDMASNNFNRRTHWFIDFGSLWDIYAGRPSRQYQKNIMTPEIIKKNLEG